MEIRIRKQLGICRIAGSPWQLWRIWASAWRFQQVSRKRATDLPIGLPIGLSIGLPIGLSIGLPIGLPIGMYESG